MFSRAVIAVQQQGVRPAGPRSRFKIVRKPENHPVNWKSDWSALRDRIEGLERAAELFMQGLKIQSEDPYAIRRKVFRPEFQAIAAALKVLRDAYALDLPVAARQTLDRFESGHADLLRNNELDNTGHTIACITVLAGLRSEMDFHLVDRSANQMRITERALQHLQRQIVADRRIREAWAKAYAVGEVACERLGAAHFLQHGIWAFKVSAEGERTDLVYGDAVDQSEVSASADALVLTEWKVAKSAADASAKAHAGLSQVRRYAAGVLGGIELADARYVVIVSEDHHPLPPDAPDGSTIVRYRGIAVNPSSPSRAARGRTS